VALLHLKKISSRETAHPVLWNYDRSEVVADGIVHALGIGLGLIGSVALFLVTSSSSAVDISAVAIYASGLLTMLVMSAAYNLWPVSPRKWLLRRFDHAAIYMLIAATYTPFLSQLNDSSFATKFLVGLWAFAFAGMVLKLNWPGRFDRLSIFLYLAMGWSGTFAYDKAASSLPGSILPLIAVGGLLYSLGVIFHSWERLRFQNAIWHGFVVLGSASHFAAVAALVTAKI
jgi:hemolysin III